MLVGAELNSELAKISSEGKIEEKHEPPPITRLMLAREACGQDWNIGHEPASNFAGVLAAKQQHRFTSRPQPFDLRGSVEIVPKMRKRIIARPHSHLLSKGWLDLESTASVEVTSENNSFPIESALLQQDKGGWRAAELGVQTIRLIFDQPQRVRRISVVFEETEPNASKNFTLRWSSDRGSSFREIVRQHGNFSSPDATRETEDYNVDLSNVTLLELIIDPDKGNG